jgi:hypothetical protein
MTEKSTFNLKRMTEVELRNNDKWWSFYNNCFPSEEREPAEVIYRSIGAGGLVYQLTDGSQTTGIATVQILNSCATAMLVYFAVDPMIRGMGNGSYFLQLLYDDVEQHFKSLNLEFKGLIWEVEKPELAENSEDEDLRIKRINFFKKNGGVIISEQYIQPPVDGISLVPMILMFRCSRKNQTLLSSETDQYIKSVYFEKYGRINGIDDEALSALLKKIKIDL